MWSRSEVQTVTRAGSPLLPGARRPAQKRPAARPRNNACGRGSGGGGLASLHREQSLGLSDGEEEVFSPGSQAAVSSPEGMGGSSRGKRRKQFDTT